MKTLKRKVEYILREIEESRNSDNLLSVNLWEIFYDQDIKDAIKEVKVAGTIYDFMKWFLEGLPSHKDIARIRAKIQNEENRYLPTSEAVRKQRKISEQNWREYLGCPVHYEVDTTIKINTNSLEV